MKFSIVIPLYNKAPYLPATLESVTQQGFTDFEVIVVDDGSSDGGPELLRQCGLPGLRLITQANAGVSVARNRGIDEARGEWVAFLDADDWWHPDYLATLVQLMAAQPQAEMVATGYRNVDHAPSSAYAPWPVSVGTPERIDDAYRAWHQRLLFFTSSVAIRRSLLISLQPCFVPGESLGEDLDVWFRAAERTPVAFCDSELVVRLHVPNNLSNAPALMKEAPFLARLEQRARRGELPPSLRQSALRFVSNNRISLARRHLASGQHATAIGWLLSGWQACDSKRWWMTLLLTCVPSSVSRDWSIRRKASRAP